MDRLIRRDHDDVTLHVLFPVPGVTEPERKSAEPGVGAQVGGVMKDAGLADDISRTGTIFSVAGGIIGSVLIYAGAPWKGLAAMGIGLGGAFIAEKVAQDV